MANEAFQNRELSGNIKIYRTDSPERFNDLVRDMKSRGYTNLDIIEEKDVVNIFIDNCWVTSNRPGRTVYVADNGAFRVDTDPYIRLMTKKAPLTSLSVKYDGTEESIDAIKRLVKSSIYADVVSAHTDVNGVLLTISETGVYSMKQGDVLSVHGLSVRITPADIAESNYDFE